MREVSHQAQFRPLVERIEHHVEIGRHAISMRLDADREVDLFGQSGPAVDQAQAFVEAARSHIGLDIDVRRRR